MSLRFLASLCSQRVYCEYDGRIIGKVSPGHIMPNSQNLSVVAIVYQDAFRTRYFCHPGCLKKWLADSKVGVYRTPSDEG